MRKRFDINHGPTYTTTPMMRVGAIVTGIMLLSGLSFAQGTGSDKKDLESVIAADSAKLTAEEKKSRTEQMLKEMRGAHKRATEILAEARNKKDIVQLNCVNEKLRQIKGLLKISEQASVKMYEGIAGGTDDVVNHEFTKMAVAHQKALILRAEADQCVGESTIYAGETEVEVEVSKTLSGDPTKSKVPPLVPDYPGVGSGS